MSSLIEDENYSLDIDYDMKYNKTPEEIREIQEKFMKKIGIAEEAFRASVPSWNVEVDKGE